VKSISETIWTVLYKHDVGEYTIKVQDWKNPDFGHGRILTLSRFPKGKSPQVIAIKNPESLIAIGKEFLEISKTWNDMGSQDTT